MEQDLSGQTIGEYEVVAPIGRGGMGMVYEGRQPVIGKRVAIKVLLQALSQQADVLERFVSEARAVNAIRHRGIVDIFSFGQTPDGRSYFVMEFLEGLPFDELIRTRAPFTPGDALRWIDEVLDTLDAAHKAGIIHRDIKPSNLFLVDTGHGRPYVKLLDFGIAKLSSFKGGQSVGEASAVVGTPDYMAPEQARAKTITGATDLYAVGCVLFELLTRERVFEGLSPVDMMFAHVQKQARAPSSVQVGLNRDVDQFCLRLLAKNPDDRPKTALAAREEVHLLLRRLNEAPTLPPPSAFTVRSGLDERITTGDLERSATPRPGWNDDDHGKGATWVTPAQGRQVSDLRSDAQTQLASGPIAFDSGSAMKPTVPQPVPTPTHVVERKGNSWKIGAGIAALALVSVWGFTRGGPPPVPPAPVVAKVEPPELNAKPPPDPKPEPIVVVQPPTPPEATVDAGPAAVEPHAAPVVKKPTGPSKDALLTRLSRLEAELKKKDNEGSLRPYINMAKATRGTLSTAPTATDLKEAAATIEEIQKALKEQH